MLNIETAPHDRDVDMRVLIELAAIDVEGTEYADLNTLFTCPLQHGAGGAAEQVIEQRSIIVKFGQSRWAW